MEWAVKEASLLKNPAVPRDRSRGPEEWLGLMIKRLAKNEPEKIRGSAAEPTGLFLPVSLRKEN